MAGEGLIRRGSARIRMTGDTSAVATPLGGVIMRGQGTGDTDRCEGVIITVTFTQWLGVAL